MFIGMQLDEGSTLGSTVISGNLLRSVIIGTYEPWSGAVLLDGSPLSIPFLDKVTLEHCTLKPLGPIPKFSDGYIYVSFTHVNGKVWTAVVCVPYQVVQSRLGLPILPSLPAGPQSSWVKRSPRMRLTRFCCVCKKKVTVVGHGALSCRHESCEKCLG